MRAFLTLSIVAAGLALAAAAHAVDTPASGGAPDLAKARALIKEEKFKDAITELNGWIDRGAQHADLYNLLGFSLRKSGDLKNAATYYRKALEFDPNHKGALEYQGEMFVMTREFVRARQNLEKLIALCPAGCEEREDLEKAIGAATASN
jgi:Flp pilus assembly protein TadD